MVINAMEQTNLKELVQDLKHHLEDNDGEVVYWGEKIVPSSSFLVPSKEVVVHQEPGTRNQERLAKLFLETIGDCHLCPLGDTRIKLTFGVGNPESPVMFVGEGPGYEEDRKGEPFVGKAGQLLDKIIAAIGLDRTKVYIANVVKCHPMVDATQPDKRGNDRPPTPEEMEKCMPFLLEQIRIIRPKIIVTLGGVSSKALLKTSQGITSLRGKMFDLNLEDGFSTKVLPTFHPAALLRDETLKKPVWEDMKQLRSFLNVE